MFPLTIREHVLETPNDLKNLARYLGLGNGFILSVLESDDGFRELLEVIDNILTGRLKPS